MTFDEMYDQMLNLEFSSPGRHAKADETMDPAAAVAAMASSDDVTAHARHAKSAAVEPDAVDAAPERERRTGFARYRTATLVGAGGLACATVGAFLGGLGGYFTVSPAGAHAVASTSQDSPLADAVNHAAQAAHAGAANGNAALAAATFSAVSGGLTKGWGNPSITTGYPATYDPSGSGPLRGAPILGGSGSGGTLGGGGSNGGDNGGTPGTPAADCTDPLSCLIANLTGALSVGTVPSDPTGMLSGILTEVTGALSNLGTLLPGLPTGGTGGLPGSVPSGGLPVVPGLPGVPGLPVTSAGPVASGGQSSGAGSLGAAVGAATGAVSGATGSTAPTVPTVPVPTSPTAPITVPTVPTAPLSTSTGSTSPVSGGLSTTITSPVPLPSTGPVTVGPVTVGTTSGTSSSTGGLTLNLGGGL